MSATAYIAALLRLRAHAERSGDNPPSAAQLLAWIDQGRDQAQRRQLEYRRARGLPEAEHHPDPIRGPTPGGHP